MQIKTISLWQPWATLVALGLKRYETRHWATDYRGPLAIHGAKRQSADQWAYMRQLLGDPRFGPSLRSCGYTSLGDLPFGAVLCVTALSGCQSATDCVITDMERMVGDFTPGRFAWALGPVERLEPIAEATGRQGFFWWDRTA